MRRAPPTTDLEKTIAAQAAENAALKASDAKRRKRDAESAVGAAIKRGAIPAQDEPLKARWTGLIEENPDNVALLAALSVKREGEAMGFVADQLHQVQHRRVMIEGERIVLLPEHVDDFFAFRDGGQRLVDDAE